ncbi:MAG: hypothetical protein ACI4CC_08005 [Lachnospiraceae bacterium]
MNKLLELKTEILGFIEKNEPYVKPAAKLVLMLAAYLMIYFNVGFYSKIHIIFIPMILAVLSAVLPLSLGVVIMGLYILLNLYGLGLEVTMVGAAVLLLCYLLYFRFAPKQTYLFVLSPILWCLRIPYVAPVVLGLTGTPLTSVSVLMGTVAFYFLKGVKENKAVFLATDGAGATSKLTVALNQLVGNKEMWIVLVAFFLTSVAVYVIRRKSIRNAWRVAIYAGIIMQLVIILCGKLLIGNTTGIVGLILGSVISMGLAIVAEFFLFNLDYTRVERVQFEDDFYYYYVKAVPKVLVSAKEKKVTTFGKNASGASKKDEEAKEQIAKELDIDPELLK